LSESNYAIDATLLPCLWKKRRPRCASKVALVKVLPEMPISPNCLPLGAGKTNAPGVLSGKMVKDDEQSLFGQELHERGTTSLCALGKIDFLPAPQLPRSDFKQTQEGPRRCYANAKPQASWFCGYLLCRPKERK